VNSFINPNVKASAKWLQRRLSGAIAILKIIVNSDLKLFTKIGNRRPLISNEVFDKKDFSVQTLIVERVVDGAAIALILQQVLTHLKISAFANHPKGFLGIADLILLQHSIGVRLRHPEPKAARVLKHIMRPAAARLFEPRSAHQGNKIIPGKLPWRWHCE